jgi:hypothetical protein
MWYRVFGRSESEPPLAALAEDLHAAGLPVEPHFKGDDLGWTSGELRAPGGAVVKVERYLTDADDLRDDLNAYAAELETRDSPHSAALMQHAIQTRQLVTLEPPADADLDSLLVAACRFIAVATDGVYQIDGKGWFSAAGELLIPEC